MLFMVLYSLRNGDWKLTLFCFLPMMAVTTKTTKTAITATTDYATANTKTNKTAYCENIPGQKPIGYCASNTVKREYMFKEQPND